MKKKSEQVLKKKLLKGSLPVSRAIEVSNTARNWIIFDQNKLASQLITCLLGFDLNCSIWVVDVFTDSHKSVGIVGLDSGTTAAVHELIKGAWMTQKLRTKNCLCRRVLQ